MNALGGKKFTRRITRSRSLNGFLRAPGRACFVARAEESAKAALYILKARLTWARTISVIDLTGGDGSWGLARCVITGVRCDLIWAMRCLF